MGLTVGDWVDLGDGRIGLISAWDDPPGMAIADVPTGGQIDRQIGFAETRWQPVPEDGLRVAAALDPAATRTLADRAPIDILVLALKDLGGRGETAELRDLITGTVVPDSEWQHWWRRTQTQLESDDRIDTSRSREKVYALARVGSSLGRSLVPALQNERRRGRRMADGPQLKRARDRAALKGPRDADDEALFRFELEISTDESADPTDRFMATELGIWLGRWSEADAKATMGDDVLSVDLLRIPAHESRSLAVKWALERSGSGDAIAFRSALALGSPWSDRVMGAFAGSPSALRQAAFGIMGWSVPGDEDAGPAKLKDDLPTFERRIETARMSMADLAAEARLGLWDGGVHALRSLPRSDRYAAQLDRMRGSIARLCWAAYQSVDASARPHLRQLEPMDRDAFAPLARSSPAEARPLLRTAAVSWYASNPTAQMPNLRVLADVLSEDLLVLGIDAAQQVMRKTNLPRIALQLFHEADDAKRTDPVANSVVTLAVTAAGEDRGVTSALDRLAEAIVENYMRGTAPIQGPITFSPQSWARFGSLVAARLEDAAANEAKARHDAEEIRTEANRLGELADQRARALTETRATASSESQQDVGRLASNLMKPVALAVGDSYEARSLESLQDRLLAVLQRVRIVPIHDVGEIASFDPVRHQWVGEGAPTNRVQARSPGFLIEGDGADAITIVPARVVAAEWPAS